MKKVAVLFSGCGFKDGAEIIESVSTMIALSNEGVQYDIFSLNKQIETVNHISDESTGSRNILAESSRISRGNIADLKELNPDNYEGLVVPGGFGVALHFCDFAQKGAECQVDPLVEKIIQSFHKDSKPIAAFCIAPALIARVLGSESVAVTIGNDKATAEQIEKTGAQHVDCDVEDYVSDRENKIITTPAYMYEEAPNKVFNGISKAIREFVEMA